LSGCPVYVLDGDRQAQKKTTETRWGDRSRVAVYLGHSTQHAKTVGLVLSLKSGLVSPQYHVEYDNLFETVRGIEAENIPKSMWQALAGFVASPIGNDVVVNESVPQPQLNEDPSLPTAQHAPQLQITQDEVSGPEGGERESEILQDGGATTNSTSNSEGGKAKGEEGVTTTRTGRVSKPPPRFDDYVPIESVFSV
jgi:hypothetical protein